MNPARPTILRSVSEVANLSRKRRNHAVQAVITGALHTVSDNPDAKGRTPRWLISEDDALAWIRAGCPVVPAVVQ